jgi:hypothetical protein
VIRIRRLPSKGILRRRRYEVECLPTDDDPGSWTKITSTPVAVILAHLGRERVGDAWALVDAANAAWAKGQRGWVDMTGLHDE